MPVTTTLISPPRLGELDDPPQHRRDPVHVLGAAVHRDLRAGGEREPLERHAELLGEVERGDDPPALGLGQRAERARRVAQQDHAQHALGVALGEVAEQCRRRCPPWLVAGGRSTGTSAPSSSRSCSTNSPAGWPAAAARAGREQLDDLGRVQDAAAARGDDPARALVERLQRLASADRRPRRRRPRPTSVKKRSTRSRTVPSGSRSRPRTSTISMPEAERRSAPGAAATARISSGVRSIDGQTCSRMRFHCSRRLGVRRAWKPRIASSASHEHALELGQRGDPPVGVAHRREVAHLGEREQPLVLRVRVRDAVEQVDVLGRRAAARGRTPTAATVAAGAPSSGAGRAATSSSTRPSGVRRKVNGVMADIAAAALGPRDRRRRCGAAPAGSATPASAARSVGGELVGRRRRRRRHRA